MNKKRGVFILVCAVIALICTAICFCFFPQYICQNVYIENVSGITGQSWFGVSEEISVMEEFIPQQKFLGSIIIYVGEIGKDISLQGKLVDSKGKILKEHIISAQSGYVSFEVQDWVFLDQTYTFIIKGHNCDGSEIPIAFGDTISGPPEHVASRRLGENVSGEGVLWVKYVYYNYSRKVLAILYAVFL